ncbi:MAG TPA: hypothetical protein VFR58_17360 [Flavisolibacter sp.]|nr:hypothetical protein [Flavisolibacter sp.]
MSVQSIPIVLYLIIMAPFTQAQHSASPVGEYYLQGITETASGFKLNADSSFEFFFSYGALDRMGKGTWRMEEDSLVFNSRQKPAQDFLLYRSRTGLEKEIIIQLSDSNKQFMRFIYCTIRGGDKIQHGVANEQGIITFRPQPVEVIQLLFELCPEKKSVFNIAMKDHGFFEFRFQPWIMELFFDDFKLYRGKNSINGPHPLLIGNHYVYRKAE